MENKINSVRRTLISTALLLPVIGCSSGESFQPRKKVALFGDSTVYGAPSHVQPNKGGRLEYPMHDRINSYGIFESSNFGINGDIPSDLLNGLSRDFNFDKWLITNNHEIVVFGFGSASAIRKDFNFIKDLSLLIEKSIAANRQVVLRGVVPMFQVDSNPALTQEHVNLANKYREELENLSKSKNLPYSDISQIPYRLEDIWDGLHPEQEYSNRIADAVHDSLLKLSTW